VEYAPVILSDNEESQVIAANNGILHCVQDDKKEERSFYWCLLALDTNR